MDAIIFDLDGVLIDSEPLWQQAEQAILSAAGLPLTRAMTSRTTGMRCDHVVRYWLDYFQRPDLQPEPLEQAIIDRVVALFLEQGRCMPQATDVLTALHGNHALGLATSTPQKLLDAVLDAFGWRQLFQAISCAEQLPLPKPHPQVYLDTAAALGVAPQHCLAIEDSFSGLIAAKAANMTVWLFAPAKVSLRLLALADKHIRCLTQVPLANRKMHA